MPSLNSQQTSSQAQHGNVLELKALEIMPLKSVIHTSKEIVFSLKAGSPDICWDGDGKL